MKRILLALVLAVAGLGLATGQSYAQYGCAPRVYGGYGGYGGGYGYPRYNVGYGGYGGGYYHPGHYHYHHGHLDYHPGHYHYPRYGSGGGFYFGF